MTLKYLLKETVIEDLKKINISMFDNYAKDNQNVLNFLYSEGIINDSLIDGALEEAVFKQARQDYESMFARNLDSAHHVGNPEYFIYGLSKNKFSKKEIKQIPLDYDETLEAFSKTHGRKNLLSQLRKELLNPQPFSDSTSVFCLC